MQPDIVERLHDRERSGYPMHGRRTIFGEAADEIERLRHENTALKQALGYPVLANDEVVNNPFKCGVCEANNIRAAHARSDALEEAATVAEQYGYDSGNASPFIVAEKIRALKEKP